MVQLLAVLTVWYFQYGNAMVINSLVTCFLPMAILSIESQQRCQDPSKRSICQHLATLMTRISMVLIASVALHMTLKSFIGQSSDNHIYQFVASWLGYQDQTDFDTRLYLCMAVFRPLSYEKYKALCVNGSLPMYAIFMLLQMLRLCLTILRKWYVKEKSENSDTDGTLVQFLRQCNTNSSTRFLVNMDECPELVYHVGVSTIFALLGMLMSRMIVFWSPYVMIMTSVLLCNKDLWSYLIKKLGSPEESYYNLSFFLRHLVLLFALFAIYLSHKESITAQLNELREFWDPDTVDLMEWINQNTSKTAAFAGTMQLMAGEFVSII